MINTIIETTNISIATLFLKYSVNTTPVLQITVPKSILSIYAIKTPKAPFLS